MATPMLAGWWWDDRDWRGGCLHGLREAVGTLAEIRLRPGFLLLAMRIKWSLSFLICKRKKIRQITEYHKAYPDVPLSARNTRFLFYLWRRKGIIHLSPKEGHSHVPSAPKVFWGV